jgi:uroporphyrinogen-III synthase
VTPRTVLVTRPAEDAAPLARRIEALGHRALCEPLLVIRFLDDAALDLDGVQAMAFTSANGVRALIHVRPDAPRRGLRVFAVGKVTAAAARAAGFGNVVTAGGNVDSLAQEIATALRPADGAVVHIAGRERAGDLGTALAAEGFESRRAVLYAADMVESLSPATMDALRSGAVDDVVIFSPRTARGFVTLLARAGLAPAAGRLRLVALSHRVVEAAQGPGFAAVAVAARPDQDALLEVLDADAVGERQER